MVKHATDSLPLLQDNNGMKTRSMEANKALVQHFQHIFLEDSVYYKDQSSNSKTIKVVKNNTGKDLAKEELAMAVNALKSKT